MFFFLSKLLPLFFYPLGLACLLIILAMLTLWKRPRTAAVSLVLALTVLLFSGNVWLSNQVTRSLEWQNLPPANLPAAEAIVVLGGAVREQLPPRPWVDVMESGDRVLHGARLYLQGKAPLVVLSGGRIAWLGGKTPESADMAEMMKMMGVPETALVQEPDSLNTYENAVNVKQILQQRGIRRVLLVTSAMHMPRSLAIFRKQGIEAIAAPTDFLATQPEVLSPPLNPGAIAIGIMPDSDHLERITRALKEYVGLVVYRLRGWL